MSILDELCAHAKERVEAAKAAEPLHIIRRRAESAEKGSFPFESAIRKPGLSFICECKKASPSKGVIAPSFSCRDTALAYERAGADAISVLTEPKWFLGSSEYLRETAAAVSLPCLRKDFVVDEYMIYEAKLLGASAVLLICSVLTDPRLDEYMSICDSLGLSALTEAHNEDEVERALMAGARIIGVNNRDLRDFSVDTGNSERLRRLVPNDVLFVSESGVKTSSDAERLRSAGADAVLVGEALMRAADKGAMLRSLRGYPKIKLCGLSRPCDIEAANALLPEYAGFVFAPGSKRRVSREKAAELKALLDPRIKAVGVFRDEAPEAVAELLKSGVIDIAQLHGSEDAAYIRRLKSLTAKPVIQAFRITSSADASLAEKSEADAILLDSGAGSGRRLDPELLRPVHRPYFLAGGLDGENVAAAINALEPYAVDVSSGIETDGLKDRAKMESFVRAARKDTRI